MKDKIKAAIQSTLVVSNMQSFDNHTWKAIQNVFKDKIVTDEAELKLMFTRLMLDVQEYPNNYDFATGKGINEFFEGENHRRDLKNRI